MRARRHLLLSLALAGAAAAGCADLADSLNPRPEPGVDPEEAALAEGVAAGAPMSRNLSNREFLRVASDLIGEPLSLELVDGWTPTTQFSGFDAVPWTNLDTKGVRDRVETLETILDRALASPKVITCSVSSPDALPFAGCASAIVEPFATRAFGRPVTAAELEAIAARYDAGVALAETFLSDAREIFLDGLRAALGSVLLSPQFVARIEAPPTPEFDGERPLDAYELASRLAFMFTGSIPDAALWAAAVDGTLTEPEVLRAQTERLLAEQTDTFVQSFMGQWLDFRAYDAVAPDSLERAMWEESWRTLADVVREDLPVTAVLQPGFAYLNADLAAHYNLVGQFSTELTRVRTEERGGILQQGSWLSLSASPLKTSPIHRGRLVQDRLLCKVIPPPDTALFEEIQAVADAIPATASVKERVESHREAGPACFACHEYMDPIGIGLEGFDQHGRLRKAYADTGRPVETDSDLLGTPFSSFRELNAMIANLDDYQRCAAEKLTVFSVRRVVDASSREDKALLDYLSHPVNGAPPSFRTMVLRLVLSKAFRSVNHGARR